MKTKRTIEETIELPEGIRLEDVKIDGKNYDLKIQNGRDGRLIFEFYKEGNLEYKMQIREKGIDFERCVNRPNHDHDDEESLQIVIDKKKYFGSRKKGESFWSKDLAYHGRGTEYFKVPFGARLDELP